MIILQIRHSTCSSVSVSPVYESKERTAKQLQARHEHDWARRDNLLKTVRAGYNFNRREHDQGAENSLA